MIQPAIWRASESNGDKPSVGYELIEQGDKLTGVFFLFDPTKPIDFATGLRVPMSITRVSTNEYHATVHYPDGKVDELSIRFEGQTDASARKAVIQQLDRPSSPQDFTFLRQR